MIQSPALAIGWQLWRRNRIGVAASAVVLALVAVMIPATLEVAQVLDGMGLPRAAAVVESAASTAPVLPLFGVFAFFTNALLFTDEQGNISSGYPQRMFALPVRTATLAFCPMTYAALILALIWVTIVLLFLPTGTRLPVLLPSLGLAAGMISLQAVAWLPLAHSWMRVALSGVVVPAVATPPLLLLALETSRGWVAAVLAGEVAVAAAVATAGIAWDRRGDVWRLPLDRLIETARLPRLTRRRSFHSRLNAQTWYDWRCHGLGLPLITAGTVTLIVAAGAVGELPSVTMAAGYFGVLLALPLFLSGSAGGFAARMEPLWVRKRPRFSFVATKPITSGELAAAKFRMSGRAAFIAAGVAVASLLIAAASQPTAAAMTWREATQSVPGGGLTFLLALPLYPLLLWRQATDALPTGLTGRRWVSNAVEYTFAALVFGVVGAAACVHAYPALLRGALASLPWVVAIAAVAKALLAGWAYRKAVGQELITRRFALGCLFAWTVATAAAAAAVWTLVPQDLVVGRTIVTVAAACAIPLARFALAPLAIDWNRHR